MTWDTFQGRDQNAKLSKSSKGQRSKSIGRETDSRCITRGQNLYAIRGMETGKQNSGIFPELLFIRYLRPWPWARVGRKRWRIMSWPNISNPPIPSLESVNKNLQMEHISQDSNFQWSPAVFRLKVFKSLGKAGKVSLDGFSTGIFKLLSQPQSISHVIPQLGVLFLVLPHLWKHNTLLKKHSSNATPGSPDIPKENYFFLALSLNSILILSPINIYFIWVYIRNIDKYKNICMLYIDFIRFFVFMPVRTNLKSPEHRDYLFLHLCSSSSYAQKKIRERHHITMLCK